MKTSMRIRLFTALLSAFLAGACVFIPSDDTPDAVTPEIPDKNPDVEPEEKPSMRNLAIRFETNASFECEIRKLDVFLYSDVLLTHRSIRGMRDSIHLCIPENASRIVTVANATGTFNDAALAHYDAWDRFEMDIKYETPRFPIMGAEAIINGDECLMTLSPLLCKVVLRSVTQYIDDDTIAENPRVYLKNCSSAAALFPRQGYSPLRQMDTKPVFLPYDIGIYTQYPNICLYCYPNEMPSTPTTPPTELVMEYEWQGITKTYSETLHPLYRNSTVHLDIALK